jgi:hypothetical protein
VRGGEEARQEELHRMVAVRADRGAAGERQHLLQLARQHLPRSKEREGEGELYVCCSCSCRL